MGHKDFEEITSYDKEELEKILEEIKKQRQKDLQFWLDSSNMTNEGEGLLKVIEQIVKDENRFKQMIAKKDGIQTN